MGSIQCYASYVRSKDDIALNALSAGWMNEFVEVLLGASIIIPISVGYLGIDRVVELVQSGGLGLGFKTLPFLFTKWGVVLGAIAGVMWFGLLFFAGITSSLAMGTPCVSFLEDEFNFSKKKAAIGFGLIIFILGLPTILFFNHGVFDEYDYWAGDVSLFVFALLETILFVWVFGINNAWKEINIGADIKIPIVFKYIMLFVTPVLLILIFASNIPEMYNKIVFSDIKEQLSVATDASLISELKSQMMYMTGSRILLISLFLGISYLVYKASKKRNNLKSQII
jgi:SNF family Na+-dependent transporter